jgi:hypothetical protein
MTSVVAGIQVSVWIPVLEHLGIAKTLPPIWTLAPGTPITLWNSIDAGGGLHQDYTSATWYNIVNFLTASSGFSCATINNTNYQ